MTTRFWKSSDDLVTAAPADEFRPDVAAAIAELRDAHGLDRPACTGETGPDDRRDLRDLLPAVNRRGFLQLTGAAAVFALAACGEKHPDTLVPSATQAAGTTPGVPRHYASVLRAAGHAVAVEVKTYDGRPIKIEGNPDCPVGRGSADLRTQAALLDLYDPDRLQRGPQHRSGDGFANATWAELDAAVGAALRQGRTGLLTGPIDGPARRRLIDALVAAANGRLVHAAYEALPRTAEAHARQQAWGEQAAAGRQFRLDRAQVVLAFGDLLGGGLAGLGEQVGYGELRRHGGRLLVVEPTFSQAGSCADVRVRCAGDRVEWVAWGVAEAVARALGGPALPAGVARELERVRAGDLSAALGLRALDGRPAIEALASALLAAHDAGKRSVVCAGSAWSTTGLHLAVEFLNGALGNLAGDEPAVASAGATALGDTGAADALIEACARGEIDTLVVAGCNPVHSHPGAAAALARVRLVVAVSDRLDETAALAHWVAPAAHDLESWGDAEPRAGVCCLQQPCIQPLWDVREAEQSLIAFAAAAGWPGFARPRAGAATVAATAAAPRLSVVTRVPLWDAAAAGVLPWRELVRETWLAQVRPALGSAADETAWWNACLARGVVALPVPRAQAPMFRADTARLAPFSAAGYQLVLSASRTLRDGAGANNPWLLEVPDPVSKVTWDNYLAISPVDAERELIGQGAVAALEVAGRTIEVPVHIQDGQHPGTLELFLGWGRTRAGAVAALDDGFRIDAFPLFARGAGGIQPAALRATDRTYQLASTQFHDRLAGRPMPLDDRSPGHALPAKWVAGTDGRPGGRLSLWGSSPAYLGRRWGMAIDLDACTGCNACVVACSAENNIPVVGRDEVRKNRELHWIRIDRYYSSATPSGASAGAAERLDVQAVHQPMLCLHCENAPCEVVCPANATMHNDQGVSLQIYNRCIGTRYCANNCPYKVRRFNWYEYSQYRAGPLGAGAPLTRIARNVVAEGRTSAPAELAHAPLQLMLNPEVTVRAKGVMEKCNFCVQRLRTVRDRERASERALPDGAITTACAQTCPTRAITFGDLNDPGSAVVRLGEAEAHRAFKALDEELNTRPAVAYLQRRRGGQGKEAHP